MRALGIETPRKTPPAQPGPCYDGCLERTCRTATAKLICRIGQKEIVMIDRCGSRGLSWKIRYLQRRRVPVYIQNQYRSLNDPVSVSAAQVNGSLLQAGSNVWQKRSFWINVQSPPANILIGLHQGAGLRIWGDTIIPGAGRSANRINLWRSILGRSIQDIFNSCRSGISID